MARITFIGLGIMGAPMARHLKMAGHQMTVYNRSRSKAELWAKAHDGTVAQSPADAAKDADVVIACVGTDDDLASITLGRDGAFAAMAKGATFIDHTTVSARIARQLAVEAKSRGLFCVDAPVSGGQAGAENGTLSIMCGGGGEAMAMAEPVMQAYAKRIVHVGGPAPGRPRKWSTKLRLPGYCRGYPKPCILRNAPRWIWTKYLKQFRAVRRKAGKWIIAGKPWRGANLILVLPSIGCARIWGWRWTRRGPMAHPSPARHRPINIIPTCNIWAAVGRIPAH